VGHGGRKSLSAKRHLELARENTAAFVELRKALPPVLNWAGTALFYAAVHYADALLASKNEPQAGNHDERWRQLEKHVDDVFLQHYLALKDLSQAWRYHGRAHDGAALEAARSGHFLPIVTVVAAQVTPPPAAPAKGRPTTKPAAPSS